MTNKISSGEYRLKYQAAFDQYLSLKDSHLIDARSFLEIAIKTATILSKIAQSKEEKKYAWYRIAICQKIIGNDILAEKYAKAVVVIEPENFQSQILLYQIYVDRAIKKRSTNSPVRDFTGMINQIIETVVVVNQTNGPIIDTAESLAKIIHNGVSDKSTSFLLLINQIAIVISEVLPVLSDNVIGIKSRRIQDSIFESVSTFLKERHLDEAYKYLEDEYNDLVTSFNEAVILYRS